MSDQTYLNVFVEEGREHVQRMNTLLLDLENDPENKEPVQELFRSAHTLKGMSATMGFEAMADLTARVGECTATSSRRGSPT